MIRALLVIVAALAAASVAAQEPSGVSRAAISEDTTLTEAEAQDGAGPVRGAITVPAWDSGERYIYVGVPVGHADITGIKVGWFPIFSAFVVAEPAEVDGYKWWRTVDPQTSEGFSPTYLMEQRS